MNNYPDFNDKSSESMKQGITNDISITTSITTTGDQSDQQFEDSFDKYVNEDLSDHYEKVHAASQLLPAWFIERMMDDCWYFGLKLVTGEVYGIETIEAVTRDESGNLWLDCRMLTNDPGQVAGIKILTAPCDERAKVSLNASHVVAAFELAST